MASRRSRSPSPSLERDLRILISTEDADSTQVPQNGAMEENGASSNLNLPSPRLLDGEVTVLPSYMIKHDHNDIKLYRSICVPLCQAALKGDLVEAKRLLGNNHQSMLSAAITESYQTILHVATGAKQTNFVQRMVELMETDDLLTLQENNGNTAFCFAAAVGSIEIAEIMLKRNPILLTMRGGKEMTPLYMAAMFGQRKMAFFLYDQSKGKLEENDLRKIFFISIETQLYDLALKLLRDNTWLAVTHHAEHGTALHMLARKPSAFTGNHPKLLKRFINLMRGMRFIARNADSSIEALELVKCLWNEILEQKDKNFLQLIREPTKLLFDAAKLGNYEFLAELIRSYPDLVHELDDKERSIFHVAIMHRHSNIFNLMYEMGFNKELIASYVDMDGNNLLHLAARYPNPRPISMVPGAALEMQQELITYKEVEMIIMPSLRETPNSDGVTPWELFISDHGKLLKEGETWMKSRAKSYSIVATLVATVVFQAAFTLPGGYKDGGGNKDQAAGTPNLLTKTWFQIFVISDAIAFFCSSISTLMFLSILTSCYTESEFLTWLPLKFMVGLLALFISITTMTLSFCSSIFLAYHDRLNNFSILTVIFGFLSVTLYVLLQYHLLEDILYSSYRSVGFFFNRIKARKHKIV